MKPVYQKTPTTQRVSGSGFARKKIVEIGELGFEAQPLGAQENAVHRFEEPPLRANLEAPHDVKRFDVGLLERLYLPPRFSQTFFLDFSKVRFLQEREPRVNVSLHALASRKKRVIERAGLKKQPNACEMEEARWRPDESHNLALERRLKARFRNDIDFKHAFAFPVVSDARCRLI